MVDYTYQSIYFAYLFFALMFALAVYFFARSIRHGYWGKQGEDVKYDVLDEHPNERNVP